MLDTLLESNFSTTLFQSGYRVSESNKLEVWQLLQLDSKITTRDLQSKLPIENAIRSISIRHCNRIRSEWGLNHSSGRPSKSSKPLENTAELISLDPNISSVGVHLFSHWLTDQEVLNDVVDRIEIAANQYQEAHPDHIFPLLEHRRVTLHNRFLALLFAPLFQIKRIVEYDRKKHALKTVIGHGYQSSTLNQYLGQLERIDAGHALMPALSMGTCGKLNYIDGHMIPYWSTMPMHKGKITMMGRVMPGSQAIISHDEYGQARFAEYYPPDIHLTQVIVSYCQDVAEQTGSSLFVIDRAANSVALANEFDTQKLGLLSMLNDNEYQGIESFKTQLIETFDDGSKHYSGTWSEPRENDSRRFVITEPSDGKTLVYWGTKLFVDRLEMKKWPSTYRARNDLQENKFKSMVSHGALNTNYGRKKVVGVDRHQERKLTSLSTKLENNKDKKIKKSAAVELKQLQVKESKDKGHGKRLKQRQSALDKLEKSESELEETTEKLNADIESLGEPRQRADRDFRKQLIMTFRTLFLENTLINFHSMLALFMVSRISLDMLIDLLFNRSGARAETRSEWIYWINPEGASLQNHRLLVEIAKALTAMKLNLNGKPIRVKIAVQPP